MKELKSKNVAINWTPELNNSWKLYKDTLAHAAKNILARYDGTKEISIMTDASSNHWSAVLLQSEPIGDADRSDVDDVKFEPLAYLSGSFSKQEAKWHIGQKEFFPIIFALRRFDFLLKTLLIRLKSLQITLL